MFDQLGDLMPNVISNIKIFLLSTHLKKKKNSGMPSWLNSIAPQM